MRQPGEQRPGHVPHGGFPDPGRPAIEEIDTGAVRRTSRLGRAFGFDGQVGLEVPVDRIPAEAKRGRERAVALTGLVAVVALVGIAVVGRDRVPSLSGEGEPSAVAVAPSETPRPTRTRRPRTPAPTVEAFPSPVALPTLPNDELRGAPQPVFLARDGDDVQLLAWEPGRDRLVPSITMPAAFDGLNAQFEGLLWRRSAVIVAGGKRDGSGEARVVHFDGSVRWSGNFPTANFAGWLSSDDQRQVAIGTTEGTVSILRLEDGAVEEKRVELDLAPEPRPSPSRFDLRVEEIYTELVGFTDNGRWLYVQQHRQTGEPLAGRISTRTGEVERLEQLSDDLIFGLQQFRFTGTPVDPVTGRRIAEPAVAFEPPSELRVVEEDGSTAFTVDFPLIIGWAWAGDGSLAVLSGASSFPGPGRTQLTRVDERGRVGQPLLDLEQPVYPSLVGARDGHVMLLLAADGYGAEVLLAMIRMEDGATASLEISIDALDTFQPWSSAWLEDIEP